MLKGCNPRAEFFEDIILSHAAFSGLGIRNIGTEYDHGIARNKTFGIAALQLKPDLFLKLEFWVGNGIAHFDKILQRHVGNGVGIGLTPQFQFCENTLSVRLDTIK